MILLRRRMPSVFSSGLSAAALSAGALAALAVIAAATLARAGEDAGHPSVSRCRQIGSDVIAMGDGTCARVTGHVRVQLGTRGADWGSGSTSTAAMRSYEEAPMQAPQSSRHLRVQSGLDAYGIFR